jgi:hypothetical protein
MGRCGHLGRSRRVVPRPARQPPSFGVPAASRALELRADGRPRPSSGVSDARLTWVGDDSHHRAP